VPAFQNTQDTKYIIRNQSFHQTVKINFNMANIFRSFFTACLFLLCVLTSNGGTEEWITSLSGTVQPPANNPKKIQVNAILGVVDQWYTTMLANPHSVGTNWWGNTFRVNSARSFLELRYDDTKRYYTANHWTLTITYSVAIFDTSGTIIHTGLAQTLSINYDPALGTAMRDRQMAVFDKSHRAFVQITGISFQEYLPNNTPVYGAPLNYIPTYLPDIWLDLRLKVDRVYHMSTTTPAIYESSVANNELPISWGYIQGAESYDVEWLFVDIPSGSFASADVVDFSKATRINTSKKHYEISLAYPRGKIIYRVRGIGRDPYHPSTRVEGTWSYDPAAGTLCSGVTANASPVFYSYDHNGLQSGLNWQYSATFVEDGKKSEALAIFDGALKGRQNVTINNSDNKAIVSEVKYDYQGRPAVQVLPAVTGSTGLQYYQYYNGSTYAPLNQGYNAANFDLDTKVNNADQMSSTSGSGNYYSSSNPDQAGANAYIPSANGYPFVQATYMNDGTGRIKKQGGAGADHKLGSGHETKFFYGTPTGQTELDRLFGNEVGFVSHYKKTLTIDANGQVNISYYDLAGRVIATALAGPAPTNLLGLEGISSATSLTDDLLGNNQLTQNNEKVSQQTILVAETGNLVFTYDVGAKEHCDDCMIPPSPEEGDGCVGCYYDLEISMTNSDGDSVDINTSASHYAQRQYNIDAIGTPITFTVNCSPGAYTITKTLKLNQAAKDQYKIDYTDNQVDRANDDPCVVKPNLTSSQCSYDCSQICKLNYTNGVDGNGDTLFINEAGEATDETEGHLLINACMYNLCLHQQPETDPCAINHQKMIVDLSPGGQYFDNNPSMYTVDPADANGVQVPNPNYLSTYPGGTYTSGDMNDWLNAHVRDEAVTGFETWFKTSVCSCTTSTVSLRNWQEVRDNWDAAWAEVLVDFHPEKCAYDYFCGGISCTIDGNPVTKTRAQLYAFEYDFNTITPTPTTLSNEWFNPLATATSSVNNATGNLIDVDESAYGPLTAATTQSTDPYFACTPNICSTCTSSCVTNKSFVENRLRHYIPVYDENDVRVTDAWYSIWYLLNDPDGIANCTTAACTSHVSQTIIDLFTAVHDADAPSKINLFRGAYIGYKEMAKRQRYDDYVGVTGNQPPCVPNSTLTPEYSDGYLVTATGVGPQTPDGFTVHFPKDPVTALFGSGCDDLDDISALTTTIQTYVDDLQDDHCELTCDLYSRQWMNEIKNCLSTSDTATVRSLLRQICENSCDNAHPDGTDAYATGVTYSTYTFYSFADVYNHFKTGTACTLPVHPANEYNQQDCSCGNLHDFITNTGLDPTNSGDQVTILADFNALFSPTGTYTWTQLSGWLTECITPATATLTSLPSPVLCGATATDLSVEDFVEAAEDDCGAESDLQTANQENILYVAALEAAGTAYINAYKNTCMQINSEVFTVNYTSNEYYFTLFFYDQAGNLVKTVPPEGVIPITATLTLQAVKDFRNTGTGSATYPAHVLLTNYKFNSLQQNNESTTPDGGTTYSWYDAHGRTVLSQNAKQAAASSSGNYIYSYTEYDVLGRPFETGQLVSTATVSIDNATVRNISSFSTWMAACTTRQQVVSTYYDVVIPSSGTNDYMSGGQKNLRNQISSITYEETKAGTDLTFDNASHYSYDINGNVQTLVQENRDFHLQDMAQSLKRVDYEYDLASGKVNAIHYQQNNSFDEFNHYYEYDAANRLTNVYSSRNGHLVEKEAKFFYYPHGPLARAEIGDKQVQGTDYALTLHGWIKGVNSATLDTARDMGKDAQWYVDFGTDNTKKINGYFAEDVFGYTLAYYNGDYSAISNPSAAINFAATMAAGSNYKNSFYSLYNGNVAGMVTALTDPLLSKLTIQGRAYRYDQLNRIRRSDAFTDQGNLALNNEWTSSSAISLDYYEGFHYDLNGNITSLSRKGHLAGASQIMDSLKYQYTLDGSGNLVNNRLNYVDDPHVLGGTYADDIDDMASGNYTYDAIGNLISDASEAIATIEWTSFGKIKKITRTGGTIGKADLEYIYDAEGNRIIKIAKNRTGGGNPCDQKDWVYTYYVRDGDGNVLSTYKRTFDNVSGNNYVDEIELTDHHIYGGGRIGLRDGREISATAGTFTATIAGNLFTAVSYTATPSAPSLCTNACIFSRELTHKAYELKNHLGNVLVTISDKRIPFNSSVPNIVYYYKADPVGYTDYYAFGAPQPGRNNSTHKFGFNGKLNDPEAIGTADGLQDYGFRIYNAGLGKFLSVDPLTGEYPELTPYQFASLNPIWMIDLDGLEGTVGTFLFTPTDHANPPSVTAPIARRIEAQEQEKIAKEAAKCITCDKAVLYDLSSRPAPVPRNFGGNGKHGFFDFTMIILDNVNQFNPIANAMDAYYGYRFGTDRLGNLQNRLQTNLKLATIIPIGKIGSVTLTASEAVHIWRVGGYSSLRSSVKGMGLRLDAHHVGQQALMGRFIPEYDYRTAPAIMVPYLGHREGIDGSGVLLRNLIGPTNARQVLARDIFELRKMYPTVPNFSLTKLIQMNKEMYPKAFVKSAAKM
jgi:RHS repeat-associated protein